jgi:hypothetical protein
MTTRRLPMSESLIHNETADLRQVDPDPLSVFLAILGAVGSFVSIAAYIEYRIEKRIQEREREERTRRELADLFMALEVEYIELAGLLKGLEVILVQGTDHAFALSELPFEFGGCRPLFTYQGYRKYDETLLAVNQKTRKLLELTSQILQRLYRYQVRIPSRLLEELVRFRDDLNSLLRGRLNYEDAFRAYYDIINKGEFLSRELRSNLREW